MKIAVFGRIVTAVLCAFFIGGTFSFCACAEDAGFSWYCKRTSDHTQPTLDKNMEFIEKYNAYYVGKSEGDKVIYLTFDAGYENGNVEKILDVLRKENVSGAFFVLEHLIKKNTDLILRMANEGHTVCNHTATHKDMSRIDSKQEFASELSRLENVYRECTGREMAKIYRPPEGRFSESNLRFADELGYATVFWSFAYADWDNSHQMSESAAKKKILDNVHDGEIMLLHPTSSTNAKILGDVIKELKLQGYRFGSLEELIGGYDGKI